MHEGGHLVSKEDHDGVGAGATGCVLDCECVIGVANDVKVDVRLSWAHHAWCTLDPDTHITCRG